MEGRVFFYFFSFRVFLSVWTSTSTSLALSHQKHFPPLKILFKSSGAMRGVNVVAMEELSDEAIAAARSRRMRER